MIIKSLNHLDSKTKTEIRKLETICSQLDGCTYLTDLDESLNVDKQMNHTFLCYEDEHLIAFLHLFIPTKSEAELSALTLSNYRRKGYFTALLLRAREELINYQIPDLLFVSQPFYIGTEIAKHFGAIHDFSEYVMALKRDQFSVQEIQSQLTLIDQKIDHLERLIDVSTSAFGDSREDSKSLIEMALISANRKGYATILNNKIVGICFARFEESEAFLFGLGMHAEFQGKGLGSTFLSLVLNKIFTGGVNKVKLEVESRNASALHVYQKLGFKAEETIDYYRVHVNDL